VDIFSDGPGLRVAFDLHGYKKIWPVGSDFSGAGESRTPVQTWNP